MPDDYLEKVLTSNLSRINEWLRFAEAKNAALLTFSSAWLVAIFSLWSNDKTPISIKSALLCASPAIFIAAFLALFSLLPALQFKRAGDTAQQLTTKNLLFYGNIADFDLATALNQFTTRYNLKLGAVSNNNHIQDLVTQLIETSAITVRKLKLFKYGVRSIIMAGALGICTFGLSQILIRIHPTSALPKG